MVAAIDASIDEQAKAFFHDQSPATFHLCNVSPNKESYTRDEVQLLCIAFFMQGIAFATIRPRNN